MPIICSSAVVPAVLVAPSVSMVPVFTAVMLLVAAVLVPGGGLDISFSCTTSCVVAHARYWVHSLSLSAWVLATSLLLVRRARDVVLGGDAL